VKLFVGSTARGRPRRRVEQLHTQRPGRRSKAHRERNPRSAHTPDIPLPSLRYPPGSTPTLIGNCDSVAPRLRLGQRNQQHRQRVLSKGLTNCDCFHSWYVLLALRLPAQAISVHRRPPGFSAYAIQGLQPETLPASQELWKSLTLGEASRRVLQEAFAIASESLGWGLQLRTVSERRQLVITPNLSLPRGHGESLPEVSCACFSRTGPPPESYKSAPGS